MKQSNPEDEEEKKAEQPARQWETQAQVAT